MTKKSKNKTTKDKPSSDKYANVVPLRSDDIQITNESDHGFSGPHGRLREEKHQQRLPEDPDRHFHALIGRLTGGISPASLALAYTDWWLHSLAYPYRLYNLGRDAQNKITSFSRYISHRLTNTDCPSCITPEDKDDRFDSPGWAQVPFDFYKQGFLLTQDWWQKATSNLHGLSEHHEDVVKFTTRQILDALSPTNFPATNPDVIDKTLSEGGLNFLHGLTNLLEDIKRKVRDEMPRGTEDFKVGQDVATTEGKVIYQNDLMELIQYAPQTDTVYAEPVVMIPAWIMKYYILDLSPENSMVRYLVEQGHTVFMISWKNPDENDKDKGLRDYVQKGVMEALDAAHEIVPDQKIHAVGYCLGGTVSSMAAALMARKKDDRLKTLTLFATQVDYEEAGELLLYIDESELAYLEDLMWVQGYLKKDQLSGAFNMLRSKDLIWSRLVEQYLLGEKENMFDLMAWNVDATRLPYRAHAEYLRSLYLNNDLAENRFEIDDQTLSLEDIDIPVFAVATRKDHISPWTSVYELHELLETDLTFLLTNGGHNAGVISEPGHKGRKFQVRDHGPDDSYIPPEDWCRAVEIQDGSWWPTWQSWLADRSGKKTEPPEMGAPDKGYEPLADAPGTYVFQQ